MTYRCPVAPVIISLSTAIESAVIKLLSDSCASQFAGDLSRLKPITGYVSCIRGKYAAKQGVQMEGRNYERRKSI